MKENLTLLVLFGSLGATALLATLLGCQSAIAFGTMPTPAITLATGTYEMPQSTTIKDSISVASIRWCSDATGNCTPTTAYTGAISVTASETICAYATESGYTQSSTGCNTYVAGNYISFTYSAWQVTMSTLLPGASIFYTLDGSTATEASIEYVGNPVTVASGTTINAVAVQTTSGGITGVTVQNGQVTPNNWKTVLSSSASQSAPYVSNYNTPHIQYGAGANACNDGVCGIPTQVGMVVNQTLPSAIGSGTTTNFNMTTEDLTGAGGFTLRWRQWPGDPSQDILTVTVGGN